MTKLAPPVIGLVALTLLVIACGAPPTPTPPPPLDILNAATEAAKQVDSYHFDIKMQIIMTLTGMTLQVPITFEGDAQPPDRVKGTMTMSMMGQKIETTMILISPTIYTTDPDTGKWQVTTVEEAGLPLQIERMAGFEAKDMEDLTFVGEEKVGDRPAYHVTGRVTSLPFDIGEDLGIGVGVNMRADYWIDKETSLALKGTVTGDMTMAAEATATAEMSATASLSMTILLSDYDKPVTIEAPEVTL